MKYYIAIKGQPVGPFEPEELLEHGLDMNSLVWNNSMPQWKSAGLIPELATLLTSRVPPSQQPPPQQQPPQQYQSWPQYQYEPQPTNAQVMPMMDIITAIKTCLVDKYCCFTGRARRSEYWWFFLFVFVVNLLLSGISDSNYLNLYHDLTPGAIFTLIVHLALFLPSLGVTVRRFHDVGQSGLLLLLFLIPIVNFIFLIVAFVFCVTDSQTYANRFGPSPKYVAQ